MADSTQVLILDELRALRSDFNNFARDTGERVSSLESDLDNLAHDLQGNGQPGRVTLLERAVSRQSQRMGWAAGVAAGVSTVVSVVAWIITEFRK